MTAFVELLGPSLLNSSQSVETAEALQGKEVVGLLFSGSWCGPCRQFAPQLAQWYKENLRDKGFEVVYMSSDRSEKDFDDFYGTMPWLALPYADRQRDRALSEKFGVQGIPTLVLLGSDGEVISKKGREVVSEDTTGESFPWKPVSLKQVLSKCNLCSSGGQSMTAEAVASSTHAIALFFVKRDSPSCVAVAKHLQNWHSSSLKAKGLEIVTVSQDDNETELQDFIEELNLPWLWIDFAQAAERKALKVACKVRCLPSIAILDKELDLINSNGREAISRDPAGTAFPWRERKVHNFGGGFGGGKEMPCIFVLCEAGSVAQQQAAEEALDAAAWAYHSTKGEPMLFAIATETSGLTKELRQVLKLKPVPPQKHPHKMTEDPGRRCDGCGEESQFHCSEGCDFDYCLKCHEEAHKLTARQDPELCLINVPEQEYCHGPKGDLTADVVTKFVADLKAGELRMKSFGR